MSGEKHQHQEITDDIFNQSYSIADWMKDWEGDPLWLKMTHNYE